MVSSNSIATVDGIGVSLAAIKALSKQVDGKDEQIAELKEQLSSQRELLSGLAERLESLESK